MLSIPARSAETGPVAPRSTVTDRCPAPPRPDQVEAVTPEGEIRLASGGLVRLRDVRLGEGEARAQALAWLGAHRGRAVAVQAPGYPDRWGRLTATVAAAAPALDLAAGLVERGLALVDPGEADGLCRPDLLAFEDEARRLRLGLWADRRYRPIAAGDLPALAASVGRFALVEGRVASVGERAARTYLNFGADWATDLTVTVPKRVWRTMGQGGVTASGLRGRRVRARGIIESRGGPALEIVVPEMLEVLDGTP